MTVNLNASLTQGFGITSDTSGVLTFQSNAAETMRIDTSGNVGIGTSSPTGKLDVVATSAVSYLNVRSSGIANAAQIVQDTGGTAYFQNTYASGDAIFGTSGNNAIFRTVASERMRIDSSGNLLVGTTSSSLTSGVGIKLAPSATAPFIDVVGSSSVNSDINYIMYSTGASAYRFYVGFGGTVYATSTTISGISDQRLKENIVDLDVGLDAIMALKPRKFDWKAGKGKDIKDDRGFIAQEFETVFPDLIDEWKDPSPEGEEPYKAVRADLIPVLVKAIQELSAKVDSQASEIAALKAKVGA